MKRALLLVNRLSREGDADLAAGLQLLSDGGFSLVEVFTTDPQAIPGLLRRHLHRADMVIVGGGDGTLNTAVQVLVETGLPLGILPMGTANDLARTLGIPASLEAACRLIAAGRTHRIDLGKVNERYFFNAASIGLAVRVTHHLSPEVKVRWGVFAYPRALTAALRENRAFHAEIICDGNRLRQRSIQITVGNGRHYGGGLTIAEDAVIDDHCLNLYTLAPQSLWRLLRLAPGLRRGTVGNRPGVKLMSGREIVLRTRRPYPVDTDGELTTTTPARFRVAAAALPVFVPEDYAGGEKGRENVPVAN
ncbi:MAG: lipid kinase [Desulfuromonadales bacterium]